MDVQSLIACNAPEYVKKFKEPSYSFLKALFKDKCVPFDGNCRQDALEAVKLDPAVLEAQVTVHTKDKATAVTNTNCNQNVGIEKKNDPSPLVPVTPATPASPALLGPETPALTTLAPTPKQSPKSFENMVLQQEAALLSLTPHQLDFLMKYADMLRRQRMITQKYLECAFCKNNGKPSVWYTSHALRDGRGRVRCPVLRGFRCPRCGATGDQAHTIKYCPDNSLIDT